MTTKQTEIFEFISNYIDENIISLNVDIDINDSLSGILSSLDVLELVMVLEREYSLEITDDETSQLKTFLEMVELIDNKLKN